VQHKVAVSKVVSIMHARVGVAVRVVMSEVPSPTLSSEQPLKTPQESLEEVEVAVKVVMSEVQALQLGQHPLEKVVVVHTARASVDQRQSLELFDGDVRTVQPDCCFEGIQWHKSSVGGVVAC